MIYNVVCIADNMELLRILGQTEIYRSERLFYSKFG
jgi:hypothetical protein